MYLAVEGTFENGHIVLNEPAPTVEKSKVVVMFLPEGDLGKTIKKNVGVKIGSLEGKGYSIPDDFNDPLDDLKDYM